MRIILAVLTMAMSAVLPSAAAAQADKFTVTPVCSDLVNESGHAIYGAVETDRAQGADGQPVYYRSNFRLKAGEKTQICSNGPFFAGGKLMLTLRSLFPLFECKTALGKPIEIKAVRRESGNGYDWSATCH